MNTAFLSQGEERFTVPGQVAAFALKRHLSANVETVARTAGALNGELREGEGDHSQEHSALAVRIGSV
jgi:hypothetical protein